MNTALRLFLSIVALVLIGNFVILRVYGNTLQSTHLFVVRSTVFYPVSWLNLILGISLGALLVWEWFTGKKKQR
jgi:hypothetical protein